MDAHAIVKPLLLKDLRIQLRARGLTPGGGIEELRERLAADMVATGNFAINMGEAAVEQQQQPGWPWGSGGLHAPDVHANVYARMPILPCASA